MVSLPRLLSKIKNFGNTCGISFIKTSELHIVTSFSKDISHSGDKNQI